MGHCNMLNLNVHMLKINLSLITLLLLTPTVNAGIFDSCFGSPGYKPISAEKLKARADINSSHMGICYEAAICLARAEGLLNKQQESHLLGTLSKKGGNSYSEAYQKIMELSNISAEKASLNINEVTESGFVNFYQNANKKFVHTAYVQVASNGEKYLYNTNNLNIVF